MIPAPDSANRVWFDRAEIHLCRVPQETQGVLLFFARTQTVVDRDSFQVNEAPVSASSPHERVWYVALPARARPADKVVISFLYRGSLPSLTVNGPRFAEFVWVRREAPIAPMKLPLPAIHETEVEEASRSFPTTAQILEARKEELDALEKSENPDNKGVAVRRFFLEIDKSTIGTQDRGVLKAVLDTGTWLTQRNQDWGAHLTCKLHLTPTPRILAPSVELLSEVLWKPVVKYLGNDPVASILELEEAFSEFSIGALASPTIPNAGAPDGANIMSFAGFALLLEDLCASRDCLKVTDEQRTFWGQSLYIFVLGALLYFQSQAPRVSRYNSYGRPTKYGGSRKRTDWASELRGEPRCCLMRVLMRESRERFPMDFLNYSRFPACRPAP